VAPAGQLAEAAQLMDRIRLIGTDRPARSGPRPAGAAGPGAAAVPAAEEAAAQPGRGRAGPRVPLAIQEAITARHVLRLDYRDRRDEVTVREVESVAFAGTRDHWYLLAWCRLREAARAFQVDRILAAVDTGEPAPHRSYADQDVDIPHALIRVPDLVG
jgi:predicted DNA-binding transcriptional regulator YafY